MNCKGSIMIFKNYCFFSMSETFLSCTNCHIGFPLPKRSWLSFRGGRRCRSLKRCCPPKSFIKRKENNTTIAYCFKNNGRLSLPLKVFQAESQSQISNRSRPNNCIVFLQLEPRYFKERYQRKVCKLFSVVTYI